MAAEDESAPGRKARDDGSPAPSLPRDEWVARVVPDPANPGAPPVVLSGYVGDAGEEGRTRVYLDPSLGVYVDVADGDVLHHEPLEGERQPHGGSLMWVRGDATVVQGGAGAAAGFFSGPVLEQHRRPDIAGPGRGPIHITAVQTVVSHLIPCGPLHTLLLRQCTWICPIPHTGHAIICSWVCRDPLGGITQPGPIAGGAPAHFAAAPGGTHTTATVCTQIGCPDPGPIGPTGWLGCTHLLGCPSTSTCPPTSMLGCPSTSTCPPTSAMGCPDTSTCPPTSAMGCPSSSTCPPEQQPQVGHPALGGFITQAFGCPRTSTCPPLTIATVCTQIGCWTQVGCRTQIGCPSPVTMVTCTQLCPTVTCPTVICP